MTADTTANRHRITSPRMFAVLELTAYLRSAVAALLAVVAVFVASRRLAGALEMPLGSVQLLVAGGLLAGLAGIARVPRARGRRRAASVLISLALFVIAASLSLSGSPRVALLGFWAVIVGEELWAWRSVLPARRFELLSPGGKSRFADWQGAGAEWRRRDRRSGTRGACGRRFAATHASHHG